MMYLYVRFRLLFSSLSEATPFFFRKSVHITLINYM